MPLKVPAAILSCHIWLKCLQAWRGRDLQLVSAPDSAEVHALWLLDVAVVDPHRLLHACKT